MAFLAFWESSVFPVGGCLVSCRLDESRILLVSDRRMRNADVFSCAYQGVIAIAAISGTRLKARIGKPLHRLLDTCIAVADHLIDDDLHLFYFRIMPCSLLEFRKFRLLLGKYGVIVLLDLLLQRHAVRLRRIPPVFGNKLQRSLVKFRTLLFDCSAVLELLGLWILLSRKSSQTRHAHHQCNCRRNLFHVHVLHLFLESIVKNVFIPPFSTA